MNVKEGREGEKDLQSDGTNGSVTAAIRGVEVISGIDSNHAVTLDVELERVGGV